MWPTGYLGMNNELVSCIEFTLGIYFPVLLLLTIAISDMAIFFVPNNESEPSWNESCDLNSSGLNEPVILTASLSDI